MTLTSPHTKEDIKNNLEIKLKAIEHISNACACLFSSDLDDLSDVALKPFCELTGANYGIVVLLKNNHLNISASYGFPDGFKQTYNNELVSLHSANNNKSWPSIKSIRMEKIIIVKDTNQDAIGFSKFFSDVIHPNKVRAVVSVPLIINGKAVGAFTKYYVTTQSFSETDLSFMKTTANIITSTIERNMLIEEATSSKKELAEVNRNLTDINKELDSFVYIASHDLREPLRTIESFISILEIKAKDKLNDEEKDFLTRIVKANRRMRTLIEDLTHLSRASREIHESQEELIDLNKLLIEVQFELTAQIQKKNAQLIINDELPIIKGDKEKISSLFKNLISNGIKFNNSTSPTITIMNNPIKKGGKVCLAITDNGIGIDEKYQGKIFDLFRRLHTQDEYEGTGAGLAIVKKIIEKYNCDIWIESKIGKGTTLYFTLPTANED